MSKEQEISDLKEQLRITKMELKELHNFFAEYQQDANQLEDIQGKREYLNEVG